MTIFFRALPEKTFKSVDCHSGKKEQKKASSTGVYQHKWYREIGTFCHWQITKSMVLLGVKSLPTLYGSNKLARMTGEIFTERQKKLVD